MMFHRRMFRAAWLCLFTSLLILPVTANRVSAQDAEAEAAKLIAEMKSAKGERRVKIVERLGEIGPEARAAVPLLVRLMHDGNDDTAAAHALVKFGGEAYPAFRAGLAHESVDVRYNTVFAMIHMAHDAAPLIPDLIARLGDSDPDVRAQVIELIGDLALRPDLSIPALLKQLGKNKKIDDSEIVYALWDFGKRARPAVAKLGVIAARHPDYDVRYVARSALAEIDSSGKAAVPAIVRGLTDERAEPNFGMFATDPLSDTLEILAKIAPLAKQAAPALLKLLKDKQLRSHSGDYASVVSILATLGVRDAISILRDDMRRPLKRVKRNQFSFTFWNRVIPPLYETTRLRAIAARELARLEPNNKDVLKVLIGIVKDRQWAVTGPAGVKGAKLTDPRVEAAIGLGYLGSRAKSALPVLKAAMRGSKEKQHRLVLAAAWAVAIIDSKDRECVKIMKSVGIDELREKSAKRIVKVLGDRITILYPDLLDTALKSQDRAKSFAIEVLSSAKSPGVRPLVLKAIQFVETPVETPDNWVGRDDASKTLTILGKRAAPAIDELVKALDSKSHHVRAEACRMLGVIGQRHKRIVPLLVKKLSDSRVIVRVRAAAALGRFGRDAQAAVPSLKSRLKDRYAWVRSSAEASIERITMPNRKTRLKTIQ